MIQFILIASRMSPYARYGYDVAGIQNGRLENNRLIPDTSSSHLYAKLYACIVSNLFLVMIGGRHSPHAGGGRNHVWKEDVTSRLAIDCLLDMFPIPILPSIRAKKGCCCPRRDPCFGLSP
jgi:hypothetical protein